MSHLPYRICNNCIMDTSDPNIRFDDRGWCDYCNNFHSTIQPNWHTDERGERELMQIAEKIKKAGEGRDFDCIIGLSGGLDSSYLTYIAKEKMGLRPLLFHVDAGWNTDQAVGNIEKLVDGLALDLYTEVINWEEMKDSAGGLFQIPDSRSGYAAGYGLLLHALQIRHQHKIKYILTGGNLFD